MAGYSALIREPGVKRLIISTIPGRIAYGMLSLTVFFFVHDRTGSIAIAGFAAGAETLAGSISAGARGSLIDRFGQTKPLSILVPLYAVLIWLLSLQHSTVLIVLLSIAVGTFSPPINLSARPLWRKVAGPNRLRIAYSIDTTILNSTSLIGPVIATTLALQINPSVALWFMALMMLTGGLLMVTMPLSRSWIPEPQPTQSFALLKSKPFLILVAEGAMFGLAWGLLQISIPASSTLHNKPALSAPLLAITAGMSIIAGIVIGHVSRDITPLRGFKYTNACVAICTLPLAFTTPGWSMGIVLAFVGFTLGCASIYHLEVIEAVRPVGSATAAQGWQWAVEGSMIAAGVSAGGYINAHIGTSVALGLVTVGMLLSTTFVWLYAAPRLQMANRPLSDRELGEALAGTESPAG